MNKIILKGKLTNTQFSHKIGDVEYNKSNLIVMREDGREDNIDIKFKKFSNPYQDGQNISLTGNIRSYSSESKDGHNKVSIYVFTYFDLPELDENDHEITNNFTVDGRICKIDDSLRILNNGKQNIHFIIANNMVVDNDKQKLNSYLPCIAWGSTAKCISQLKVNDQVEIHGELHSREYLKTLPNGEQEIRVAHECVVTSINLL